MSRGLYRLEAFGWSPWNLWRLAQGDWDAALERDQVHAEDFGDEESREIALRLNPGLRVNERPRSDPNPRIL